MLPVAKTKAVGMKTPGCAARRTPALVALAVCLPPMAFAQTAFAQEATPARVTPAQVVRAVSAMRADLEGMRFVMGAPVATPSRWQVTDAAPRHALSTAKTSFAKVNRLAFEVAGEPLAQMPASAATPAAEVLATVAAAHGGLRTLMARVGVEPSTPPRPARDATWADALVEIVEANRQLNEMLVREFRPEEIYDVIIALLGHVAGVADAAYPPLPQLVVGKTPTDVYQRLLDCYELTHQAEAGRDMRALALNLRRERRREGVPSSEAYDLSRLLLADIVGMDESTPTVEPPYPRPYYIYSAHVHRLTDILADMLATLETVGQ